MTMKLPVGGFRFLSEAELLDFNPITIDENSGFGYLVTADIDIPLDKHEFFSELPPLPEKIKIDVSNLSCYQTGLQEDYKKDLSNNMNIEKLSLNLFNKEKYTIHFRLLKYFVSLGVIVKKIHSVVKFREEAFLKPFIKYHTKKRQESKSEATKKLHKYWINSCYGVFLLRKELYQDFFIARDSITAVRLASKREFQSFTIIDDCTSLLQLKKPYVYLNKFPYVGSMILENSKIHFYRVWYEGIKKHFGPRVKLISYDTDSYNMLITSPDCDKELSTIKLDGDDLFDFSAHDRALPSFSLKNKGALGLLKSETKGFSAVAFVGLAQKIHSLKLIDKSNALKCKGIPYSFLRKCNFDTYKNTLFTR